MTTKAPARAWFTPGLIGLHLFAVAAIIFCIVMGLWQAGAYDSRQQHEQADKQDVPTVDVTTVWKPGEPFTARLNHRPITATGQFAPARDQFWVTDKTQDGAQGAWLLSPFMVDGQDAALLVVRGWAAEPADFPDVPQGTVTLSAVLEPGEASAAPFDQATRTLGSVRVPEIINVVDYDVYSGYALNTDASLSSGLALVQPPAPGDVKWTVGLKNLTYAFQWWAFGLFAAFMWWRMTSEIVKESTNKEA